MTAAVLVNVEFGDGYSAVANAEYFLGTSPEYFWQRGPLMSLLLVPAEWVAQHLALGPLDVRPHHAMMAALHFLYLLGVWRLLAKHHGPGWASSLGFVMAVPTVVFFSYAPFISHDILPGLGLLYLAIISDRFSTAPTRRDWLLFSLVSAALVLIKQTYAVMPLAVLLGRLLALALRGPRVRAHVRRLFLLGVAVAIAGVVCWLIYAALVAGRFKVPFLQSPWALIEAVSNNYRGQRSLTDLFYPWMYLHNAAAYGILAMTLVLPGIAYALARGDVLQRQLAITWLLLFGVMQLIPYKEVRYLAFLAPISAFLIIPVVRLILDGPARYRWLIGLVLVVDVARVLPEALRVGSPYYQNGVTEFFAPLAREGQSGVPIFFGNGWLSFVSPERDAFFGDPFHRVTEMQVDQLRVLHHWKADRVFRIQLAAVGAAMERHPDAIFLLQNWLLSRSVPLRSGSLDGLPQDFVQTLSHVETVQFIRVGNHYVASHRPEVPRILVRATDASGAMVIAIGKIDPLVLQRFANLDPLPDRFSLRVLAVSRLCRLHGCSSFER